MPATIPRMWAPVRTWMPPQILPTPVDARKVTPSVFQSADWTCSCASLAWVMTALDVPSPSSGEGVAWTEWDGVNELRRLCGPLAVTPEYGLAFGNGRDLETVYRAYGFDVERIYGGVNWETASSLSRRFIGQFGGGRWYHWTGTRWFDDEDDFFSLANPAPSWKGVGQELDAGEYATWGPWTGLWIVGLAAR